MIDEIGIVTDNLTTEGTVAIDRSMAEEIVATMEETTTIQETVDLTLEGTEITILEGIGTTSMAETETDSKIETSTEIDVAIAVSLHEWLENRESILHRPASETVLQAVF
jgi:hypothetical protein